MSGIDSKGRTTLPSEIRDVVHASSNGNIVCISRHPSLPCLIGHGRAERQANRDMIEDMRKAAITRGDDFDEEEIGSSASSLYEFNFETSGRFGLSPMLRHFGKLTDRVFFHSTTTKFLLWNPDVFLSDAPGKFKNAREELEYWLSVGGKGAK